MGSRLNYFRAPIDDCPPVSSKTDRRGKAAFYLKNNIQPVPKHTSNPQHSEMPYLLRLNSVGEVLPSKPSNNEMRSSLNVKPPLRNCNSADNCFVFRENKSLFKSNLSSVKSLSSPTGLVKAHSFSEAVKSSPHYQSVRSYGKKSPDLSYDSRKSFPPVGIFSPIDGSNGQNGHHKLYGNPNFSLLKNIFIDGAFKKNGVPTEFPSKSLSDIASACVSLAKTYSSTCSATNTTSVQLPLPSEVNNLSGEVNSLLCNVNSLPGEVKNLPCIKDSSEVTVTEVSVNGRNLEVLEPASFSLENMSNGKLSDVTKVLQVRDILRDGKKDDKLTDIVNHGKLSSVTNDEKLSDIKNDRLSAVVKVAKGSDVTKDIKFSTVTKHGNLLDVTRNEKSSSKVRKQTNAIQEQQKTHVSKQGKLSDAARDRMHSDITKVNKVLKNKNEQISLPGKVQIISNETKYDERLSDGSKSRNQSLVKLVRKRLTESPPPNEHFQLSPVYDCLQNGFVTQNGDVLKCAKVQKSTLDDKSSSSQKAILNLSSALTTRKSSKKGRPSSKKQKKRLREKQKRESNPQAEEASCLEFHEASHHMTQNIQSKPCQISSLLFAKHSDSYKTNDNESEDDEKEYFEESSDWSENEETEPHSLAGGCTDFTDSLCLQSIFKKKSIPSLRSILAAEDSDADSDAVSPPIEKCDIVTSVAGSCKDVKSKNNSQGKSRPQVHVKLSVCASLGFTTGLSLDCLFSRKPCTESKASDVAKSALEFCDGLSPGSYSQHQDDENSTSQCHNNQQKDIIDNLSPFINNQPHDVTDDLAAFSNKQMFNGCASMCELNAKWEKSYPSAGFRSCQSASGNEIKDPSVKVHFAVEPDLLTVHIVGTEERAGNWHHFGLDRERFRRRILEVEKIVSPVLECSHRVKILERLQH